MQIQRILHPTDFSRASEAALPHCLQMAQRCDAQIHLLHVRTLFADDPNRAELEFFDESAYEQHVAQIFSELTQRIDTPQTLQSHVERDASAASAILQFCDAHSMDMVVMGTHGRSALGHFFMGSVTERVVRHCRLPVLTVAHHQKDYRSNPDYKRILVAFDFSEHSREALRQAYWLGGLYKAQVTVAFVVERDSAPAFYEMWRESISEDLDQIAQHARQALSETIGEEGLEEVEVRVEVGSGSGQAHSQLRDLATHLGVDLIVMGTHGLSGFQRFLLGSTTERLVRVAPCPVLTFHLPAPQYTRPGRY